MRGIYFEGGTANESLTTTNTGLITLQSSAGTRIRSAAAAHNGSYGVEWEVTAPGYSWGEIDLENESTTSVFSVGFEVPAIPTGNEKTILQARSLTGSLNITVLVTATGKLRVQAVGQTTIVNPFPSGTYVLIPGTKYVLNIAVTIGTTTVAPYNGVITAQLLGLDGTVLGSVFSNTANTGTTPINRWRFGILPTTDNAWKLRNDNVRVWDNTTVLPGPYVPGTNNPPVVTVGVNQLVNVGATVALTSSTSDDSGATTGVWSFDQWPPAYGTTAPAFANASANNTTFVATVPGRYVVRRTSTDSGGLSDSKSLKVFIRDTNVRPISVLSDAGGWTVTGADTAAKALADADANTYTDSPTTGTNLEQTILFAPLQPRARIDITPVVPLQTGTLTFNLKSGSTTVKSWTVPANSGVLTMTEAEVTAANLTDTFWNEPILQMIWSA
jgi:hypothetical protein